MEWWVELIGHRFDLEELRGLLEGGPHEITEEDGQFLFRSDRFNEIENASEVRNAAQDLMRVLNGLARVRCAEFQPVFVGDVRSQDSSGRRFFHAFVWDGIGGRDRATTQAVLDKVGAPGPCEGGELNFWLGVADADPLVKQVLEYLNGPGTTWNDLYRAMEVVQSDVGGLITEDEWLSKKALSRLTRTANSHAALGAEARHGTDDTEPPPHPMSFLEAFQLVRTVVSLWLDHKCGS